ncbi:MAG TPA: CHAD domain-containing protein [Chloroflexia bacterium]|nr:CHAD domain-containing protein [Chloroflexia bacterium]
METESKFIVPGEAAFARLRAIDTFGKYERRAERTKQVHDRYLDTRGRAFLKAGWCFRLREGAGGDLLITLKSLHRHTVSADTASTAIQARDEYETSVTGLRIATWPESEAKELAARIAGKQPMRDLVTIDQVRTVSYLYDGERAVAELSLDDVDFHPAATGEPEAQTYKTYELEAELLPDGTIDDLIALALIFTEEYGLDPQPYSKFERALRFADLLGEYDREGRVAGKPPRPAKQTTSTASLIEPQETTTLEQLHLSGSKPALEAVTPKHRVEIHNTDSMAAAARKLIAYNYEALLANEAGVRFGEESDAIHDMRVASRRMRAAFRVFDPYLTGKRAKEVRDVLRVVATELGAVRDLDVLIENAETFRESLPPEQRGGLASMTEEWRVTRWKARKSLMRLLDSKEYSKFKQNMERFLAEPTPAPDQTEGALPYQVRHVAGSIILMQYEAVRATEALPNPPTVEQLHALRIVGKYFRYTLEFFRTVLPKDVGAMIRDVVKLQDQLGEMHDADVAAALIRDFAGQRAHRHSGEGNQEAPTAPGLDAYLKDRTDTVARKQTEYETTWLILISQDWRKRLALLIAGVD